MVDFIGAEQVRPERYDRDQVFRTARPRLEELRRFGCVRLQECTPAYLARDPALLGRLADATGLEIWTNTGLYGAANHKFLPAFARPESATQLAARWIEEARRGIDGVKPRFIKIGVNKAPLDPLDRKLVEAAAITARETGLTIASHTADGAGAVEQVGIVAEAKLSAAKFVWVHAQSEKDHGYHERVARAGAWVEFDGVRAKSAEWHRQCLEFMAGKDLLRRTLISQDSGWYRVGEPGGGQYNGYTYIYTDFLPKLPAGWAQQLMVSNPQQAFG